MASLPKARLLLPQWSKFSAPSMLKCNCFQISLHSKSNKNYQFSGISLNSQNYHNFRSYSSKTPPNSAVNAVSTLDVAPKAEIQLENNAPTKVTEPVEFDPATLPTEPLAVVLNPIPVFSGIDIREADEETRIKLHKASSAVAEGQSYSLINSLNPRRRKEILIMEEEEYAGTLILQKKPPLLDRRHELETWWSKNKEIDKSNLTDQLVFLQTDIDTRPKTLRRVIEMLKRDHAISLQGYKPKRNAILGNDLAAAHFVVVNKGKVKFLGQNMWYDSYRKDAKEGLEDEDLPPMKLELCTLPTKYDPRYRVEAIDFKGFGVHFEGLANFENLNYVKWISLRDQPHIDDWCLDKVTRIFNESLEYIDLSGCKKISDRGIGAFHRCRNLKAIRVENLPHIENLEIVSALLEEHNPNLQMIGIDYEGKMEQLRLEGEELTQKALEHKQQLLLQDPASDDKEKEQETLVPSFIKSFGKKSPTRHYSKW